MEEDAKEWLGYLQNRLNRYERYFNFVITTTLAMVGLVGSIISFSTDDFYVRLTGAMIIAIGVIVVWASSNRVLNKLITKKRLTCLLIESILYGEKTTSIQIKEEWEKIKGG